MIATFAELLKVKIPFAAAPDNENQLKSWLNKGGKGREYLVLQNVQNNLSIEEGKWKFIAPSNGPAYQKETNMEFGNLDKDQLHDLTTESGENVNVAARYPEIVERHRKYVHLCDRKIQSIA